MKMNYKMNLSKIASNNIVKITKILENDLIKKRLYELGLDEGSVFEVVKNNFGTVIIQIDQTKFLIGEGMSKNIEVELCKKI
jgi:Fe2+ transport system protein FeoA